MSYFNIVEHTIIVNNSKRLLRPRHNRGHGSQASQADDSHFAQEG